MMTEPTVNSEFFEQALSLAKTVGTTKLTRMILEERNELTPEKAENIDSQIHKNGIGYSTQGRQR